MTSLLTRLMELKGPDRLYDRLGTCHPKLSRGQVWCTKCGHTERVSSPEAMRNGWPKCCGYTMTIDSPDERAALQARGVK